jgi:MGT family glycosyltransferase
MNRSRPLRFLLTTWEGGGSVPPALTLAAGLVHRGHHVRVASDLANRTETELTGAEFVPWKTAPSRPDRYNREDGLRDWEAADPQEGFALTLRTVMTGPALAYARDVLAKLEGGPADLVVSSEMLFGVMAACESVKQPLALFAANLCFFPLPGMPAFGPGLPPPRNDTERELHAQIKQATIEMADAGLPELNAARGYLGLAPLVHVIDQIDAADVLLLGTSRAFDFPVERLPAKIRYVGPQLGEPGWAAPWVPPWPVNDRRPLLVIGFSTTFQNHAGALQAVVDAAARLPVRALVTLGVIDRSEVQAAPNVWLVPSAPHDVVMGEATVIVTHGGHGTVMRALKHRRPMLIMPHGRDQDDNAVRVSERGAGLVLPAASGAAEIFAALERLLGEPEFRHAADRLGAAIEIEARQTSAIDVLESLAGCESPVGAPFP